MPFAIQTDTNTPTLVAYELPSESISDPQPTISAQLIAGWICPECKKVLRAIAGPWSDPRAEWWSYDHHAPRSSSQYDKPNVRPSAAHSMPRYRGQFGTDGGYLRRFDHVGPLGTSGYETSSARCSLGVSMRVGLEQGLRAMYPEGESVLPTIVEAIELFGPSSRLVFIPDVLGQREPLIATTAAAQSDWRTSTTGMYGTDERKRNAWERFATTLVGEH